MLENRPSRHLTVAILMALGKEAFRAPHPVFLANAVFGVRVAAVVQINTACVQLSGVKTVNLEVQKRLWPRSGAQPRRRQR
jgi:hypothetical protein